MSGPDSDRRPTGEPEKDAPQSKLLEEIDEAELRDILRSAGGTFTSTKPLRERDKQARRNVVFPLTPYDIVQINLAENLIIEASHLDRTVHFPFSGSRVSQGEMSVTFTNQWGSYEFRATFGRGLFEISRRDELFRNSNEPVKRISEGWEAEPRPIYTQIGKRGGSR